MKQIINGIKSLDMFVLNMFQGPSHWSDKTCKLNNFWWARFCLYFFVSITCLFYTLFVNNENVEFIPLVSFIVFIVLVECLAFFYLCNIVEKYYKDGPEGNAKNMFISELLFVRILILVVTVSFHVKYTFTIFFVDAFLGISGIDDMNTFLYVIIFIIFTLYFSVPCAFLYFVSCTPLPPAKENAKLFISTA